MTTFEYRKCERCKVEYRPVRQDWRGALNFSIPVLTLILAILTVIFSSGREFYNAVTYTPRVDAIISDAKINLSKTATPYIYEMHGGIHGLLVNGEDLIVTVWSIMDCRLLNSEAMFGRPSDEEGSFGLGYFFTLPAKSEEKTIFHTNDFDKD
jgi:hypothetical protein